MSSRASYGVDTISKTKLPAENSEANDPCRRRGARMPRVFVHGHYQYQLNRSNIDCWLRTGQFGKFSRPPHTFEILPPTRR